MPKGQKSFYQCHGYSPLYRNRITAIAETYAEARQHAIQHANQWIKQRPETGPLSEWTFRRSSKFEDTKQTQKKPSATKIRDQRRYNSLKEAGASPLHTPDQ